MKLWQSKVVIVEALHGLGAMCAHAASTLDDVLTKIDVQLGNEPERHFSDESINAAAEQFVSLRTPPPKSPVVDPFVNDEPDFNNMTIQQIAEFHAQSGQSANGVGHD